MRLTEELASRSWAGMAPWADIQRGLTRRDVSERAEWLRWRPAVEELRSVLADGRWHDATVAQDIAARYGYDWQVLIDRAGAYYEKRQVVWPAAMD